MTPLRRYQALGRMKQGEMNRTERAYANRLEAMKLNGQVLWYRFDCFSLRLADKTFYKPDFLVMNADNTLAVHEVKGFMTDDANVKIKVAAEQFPILAFVLARLVKNQWEVRDIG